MRRALRAVLPELSRRYQLTPTDLDDMTRGEVDVYVEHLNATIAAEQAERDAIEAERRRMAEAQRNARGA